MEKFEEIAKDLIGSLTNADSENNEIQTQEYLITSDGKEIHVNVVPLLKTIISNTTNEERKTIGVDDLYERIVRNFITANTKEDIDHLIRVETAIRVSKLIAAARRE